MSVTSIIDSDNKHAKVTREALARYKKLTSSLDGWEFMEEQEGVKLYKHKEEDPNMPPLVRGDTILEDLPPGCTPFAASNVAAFPGCRKIWDLRFEEAAIKEIYTRYEALFWVKLKAPWPISPRDFVGTSIRDVEPNQTHISMLSVEDSKVPETEKAVRARLLVSGWKMYQTENNKIGITYVSQTDLSGYLPIAFLKKLLLEVPLCAGRVRNYIRDHGFPPTTTLVGKHVEYAGEDFDHESKTYTLDLKASGEAEGAAVEIVCSSTMYPHGVKAQLKGEKGDVELNQDQNKNYLVVLKDLKGSHITVTITSKD